jgi:restriction endonuclease S subunit
MQKISDFIVGNGSIQKNISIDLIKKLDIPIPTTDQSIQQWVDKISKPFDEKNTKAKRIKELEEQVQTRIKEIIENEDCDEVELGSICDIFNATRNFAIEKYNNIDNNQYGFIRGNDISTNENMPIYYISKDIYNKYYSNSKCIVKTNDILVASCSKKLNFKIIGEKWNNFAYHGCIRFTNFKQHYKYIYNYMTTEHFKILILSSQRGTTVAFSNVSDFKKVMIPIPKDKSLITALEPTFQEIEKLQDEVKQAETLYKQYLDELGTAAIKKDSSLPSTPSTQPLPLDPTLNTGTNPSTPAKKAAKIIKRKSPTNNSSKPSSGGGVSLDDIIGKK